MNEKRSKSGMIARPPSDPGIGPRPGADDETHALCPACRGKGTMPPKVAEAVAKALEGVVSDGPCEVPVSKKKAP